MIELFEPPKHPKSCPKGDQLWFACTTYPYMIPKKGKKNQGQCSARYYGLFSCEDHTRSKRPISKWSMVDQGKEF